MRTIKFSRNVEKAQLTTYAKFAIEFEITHQIQIETNANHSQHPYAKATNFHTFIRRLFLWDIITGLSDEFSRHACVEEPFLVHGDPTFHFTVSQ